jgi:hypothetical protein
MARCVRNSKNGSLRLRKTRSKTFSEGIHVNRQPGHLLDRPVMPADQ